MSDFESDAFDDELRHRFAAGAPTPSDPDVVLDALRPRLQRARRRRRASIASALGGVAMIVVVLALVVSGGGGGTGSVRTPPASRGPVRTLPATPTTPTATPTTTPAGGSATPDPAPDTSDDHRNDGTSAATPAAPADSVPAPTPTTDGSQLVPAGEQASYSSAGGSIVVDLVAGRATLASSSPAAGYGTEVHDNGPTRVEVRFSNGATEWRIRVDVVDGRLVPEITQH